MAGNREANTAPVYVGTAEKVEVEASSKVKCVVHFRRHWEWKDYMLVKNDNENMCYGFDWLGDYNFDFGGRTEKTPITPYLNRHGYNNKLTQHPGTTATELCEILSPDLCSYESEIEYSATQTGVEINKTVSGGNTEKKTSANSSDNGSIVISETVNFEVKKGSDKVNLPNTKTSTKAVGQGYADNLVTCIAALEREYGQTSIHGDKYYCSYLNVKFNREITLFVGIKDLPSELKFGQNEDEIHLIAESKDGIDYNQYLTITPKVLKKENLIERVEQIETRTVSPEGYSIIKQVNIKLRGVELKIKNTGTPIKNDIYIKAYHVDKDTQRNSARKVEFPETTVNEEVVAGKPPRMVGKMYVKSNQEYYEQRCYLVRVKRKDHSNFATGFGKYKAEEVKKTLTRTMWQASIHTIIDDSEILIDYDKTCTTNNQESIDDTLKAFKKHLKDKHTGIIIPDNTQYVFLHDYSVNGIGGYATLESYSSKRLDYANVAMIFEMSDSTIPHEVGHNLGLNHPFILETANEQINFGVPVGTSKAIYFTPREKDMEHIFWRARTENIMDYPGGHYYDRTKGGYIETKSDPTPSSTYPYLEYRWVSRRQYYVDRGEYRNVHTPRISFWKWQWLVMQGDDELKTIPENA